MLKHEKKMLGEIWEIKRRGRRYKEYERDKI